MTLSTELAALLSEYEDDTTALFAVLTELGALATKRAWIQSASTDTEYGPDPGWVDPMNGTFAPTILLKVKGRIQLDVYFEIDAVADPTTANDVIAFGQEVEGA